MSELQGRRDFEGMAALGICESLLLALTDGKILSEQVARGVLEDVVAAQTEAAAQATEPQQHRAVITIMQRILDGKNGVRHQAAD